MFERVRKQAEKYIKKNKRKKLWYKVVTCMAAVVIFITTYMLILPAITMEKTTNCGLEIHQHSKECYDSEQNLICGYADFVVHTHDENCYDQSGKLLCDLPEVEEHEHQASCYQEEKKLVCGQEESEGHVHEDDCYISKKADLICTQEEHTHSEDCYDEEGNLICERVEHEHTDDCYQWDKVLSCEKEESAGHTHTEDCYVTEKTLVCEKEEVLLHTHTDKCMEEGKLVCGKTEVLEHQHTEECYPERSDTEEDTDKAKDDVEKDTAQDTSEEEESEESDLLTAEAHGMDVLSEDEVDDVLDNTEEVTEAINVSPYITDAELKYREKGTSDWLTIKDATIPGDADLRLDVTYKNVPLETLLSNGGKLTYTLPSILRDPVANGEVTSGGKTVGTITVENNILTITFDETWLRELQNGGNTTLDGTFYVESQINLSEVGEEGKTEIIVGDVTIEANFESEIISKYGNVDVVKSVEPEIIKTEDGDYLEYTLTVTAGIDGCPDVKVVDTFSANGNYVSYVGLSTTETALDSTGSPSETIADGMAHGSIYKDTTSIEEPGSLVWVIGDMAANEVRTLTYQVKLEKGYTYIQNSTNKVISNEADVYSKDNPRDTDTANFEPKATLNMKKSASEAIRNEEDGSYTITYTVWIEAASTNKFVLENVRIEDSLNNTANATFADSLQYISYVDDSFKLFSNKTATGEELQFEKSEEIPNNPALNSDKKGFVAYVGDMEPGSVRCIQYQVRVGLEAIGKSGGEKLSVKNRALVYSDNAKNGKNEWLQAYNNTKTIQYDHWAKKLVGDPLETDENIAISGNVYDATGDIPVKESSPPDSFTAPAGSYCYTVTVNELGDWDVTSASMKDTLGNQYMQFVGYVKVEAYDPDDSDVVKETVWVKIDRTQTFDFTLKELGISDNKYAYRLIYYAKPVQIEGVSQVVVANTFQLSGDIIIGDNVIFILTGIEASAEVTVEGGNSFEAHKSAWYYEGAKTSEGSWSNGALYWAIKVDGTDFKAGTYLQDYTTSQSAMVFRSDSLVGIFTGSFPDGTDLTDCSDVAEALKIGTLTALDNSYYTATLSNSRNLNGEDAFSELTIQMNQTVTLGETTSMYIIVKLAPAFIPNNRGSWTYNNYLKSSDNGTDWQDRGNASKILYGGSNILKELGTTFTYDGKNIVTKTSDHGGTVFKECLPEPGYYVSWAVKVNFGGDLSGRYRIVDQIPDGMEIAYARIKWRGSEARGTPGAQMIQITDLGPEWTEHTMHKALDGENALDSYYYTNGNQVCWEVAYLIAGGEEDIYSVDFQVVCRVTDPEVLLGGESKDFNNKAILYTEGGNELDSDVNGVAISTSTMEKEATEGESIIPFTIKVNPLGEDLLEGTDTLTVVDTLSDTLKLDPTSIAVVNTKTQETVEFTASQEGQILKITVPDNQPLTISYKAKVQAAPNTTVAIKNDAYWEGYATTGGSSVEIKDYSYSVGGTAGGTGTPFVEIVKYDQNDLTSVLAGATFTMQEGTMENGIFTPSTDDSRIWTDTTDDSGKLKFGKEPLMQYNTVYQITETVAPNGYVLDSTPRYFIVAKADEDGRYPDYPDGVDIHYGSSTYTCEIANHKGEAYVEKKFEDANDGSVNKINGTYRFGIYDNEAASGSPLQTVAITYENNSVTPEDGKAKFTNLELGKTYYIYELDDTDQPIKNNMLATVDKKTFDVLYTNGPEITISNDGESPVTVTVTNKVHYTSLPDTGGGGTLPFTMGGLLIIAAGLLYGFSMRRKKGRRSEG